MKSLDRIKLMHARRQAVLDLLAEHPHLTRTEIAQRLGWAPSDDVGKVFLRAMMKLGEIARHGAVRRQTYTAIKRTTRPLDELVAEFTETRKRAGATKSATAAEARAEAKRAKGECDDEKDAPPYTVPAYVNGRLVNDNPRRPPLRGQTGAQGGQFGAIRRSGSYMEGAG